ncbi:hypothetical protein QOZ80_9AG0685310 [Eleusine coracana subsp. coracana]|nr:hypothetical protein QOZ80_9AG0685310 [Eleusine coracana subsp. coracana]
MRRDYGSSDGNLTPALNLFYSSILCQGALYLIWLLFQLGAASFVVMLGRDYRIPRKWAYEPLIDYLFVSRAKCWRDPASIDWNISHYAVQLIDSASWEDNLWGLRMLAKFIKQGANVRSLLLPSRARIQKLIDTLGWRETASRDMRESAACIVAHLAGDIHLLQFPGAIQCISSLLQDQTTQTYFWTRSRQEDKQSLRSGPPSMTKYLIIICEKLMPMTKEQKVHSDDDEAASGCNELILQGLAILERLALDHQNCSDICISPAILQKITTHLYSATLIQDIKARGPLVDIVNGTFIVLYKLICAPDEACRRLRRDISTNERSVTNLERILNLEGEAECRELQIRAMEILTELASDSSINLTREVKESIVHKQLQIFLADEPGEDSAATCDQLKATAGEALALLSTNSEMNSAIVIDSFGPLTEVLDAENIEYRVIAAKILKNLCAHCDLDKERVKEALLPKVIRGILYNTREPPHSFKKRCAPVGDEENQRIPAAGIDSEECNIPTEGDIIDMQEIPAAEQKMSSADGGEEKELQEALLSLILVIYEKVIDADDFDEVQKIGPGHEAFVMALKTIVRENCEVTIISLKIVKLCSQIARSMMRRNQYTEEFRNQGFVELLPEAKKIMCNLESCLLFSGTDRDLNKAARPLLSELEEQALELVS